VSPVTPTSNVDVLALDEAPDLKRAAPASADRGQWSRGRTSLVYASGSYQRTTAPKRTARDVNARADLNSRNPEVDERLGCPDSLTLFQDNRPSLVSNPDTGRCLRPLGIEEFQFRDDRIGLEEDPQNVL